VRSHRWSSLVFLAGVLAVFGALGWMTFHALRLEKAEQLARAEAKHQENIRLALWRMDSMIAPILAREAARPYFEYRSFYPADTAYTRFLSKVAPGEVLVPSPLLQPSDPYVKLHFERSPDGDLTSPQVPTGRLRPLAESVYVSGYSLAAAEQTLVQLTTLLTQPQDKAARDAQAMPALADKLEQPAPQQSLGPPQGAYMAQQQAQIATNALEYQTRSRNIEQVNRPPSQVVQSPTAGPPRPPQPATPPAEASQPASVQPAEPEARNERTADEARPARRSAPPAPITEKDSTKTSDSALSGAAPMHDPRSAASDASRREYPYASLSKSQPDPVLLGPGEAGVVQREFIPAWVGLAEPRELVYTRIVEAPTATFTQGFWVDWPALSAALLSSVQDLLPGATLRPLASVPGPDDLALLGRSLASVPAELLAPAPVVTAVAGVTPVRSTLLVTWIAALGAVIAIALVLRASLELAERRGRFVSAVTHELRTPLTTFCLYSQMLADGMVPTEEARRSYVRTLNSESQRLARIVESVLDYARLGRSKHGVAKSAVAAAELIDRLVPPLTTRCEQAGMTLTLQKPETLTGSVLCEPAQVERIVYNLVDNACKYAADADDKRVHLAITSTRGDLHITVRDHGPGIDPAEYRRIFRPFFRGQKHADGSTPGLGLGLALSHALARECRGDLKLLSAGPGAEFRLRLPLAT